jgi:hypothetical protein
MGQGLLLCGDLLALGGTVQRSTWRKRIYSAAGHNLPYAQIELPCHLGAWHAYHPLCRRCIDDFYYISAAWLFLRANPLDNFFQSSMNSF